MNPDSSARPARHPDSGIRISDAAELAGVSPRTLRYYEELGLLSASSHTSGGERRYTEQDLTMLSRILELRELLGMSLEEVKEFLSSEARLDTLRVTNSSTKGLTTKRALAEQEAVLRELLRINESLAEILKAKTARINAFRRTLAKDAQRCRDLLGEYD